MTYTLKFMLAAACLGCMTQIAWAEDLVALMESRFEPVVQQTMKENSIPAVAVAVLSAGQPAYVKAFGVKSVDAADPVVPRSLFHMASVTKTFVATAIIQLWEQGKVDLDKPVIAYLPYFKLDDPHYSEITLAQMLNHTSGIPDVMNYEWNKPAFDDGALESYVRSISDRKLISPPGTKQKYSNMSFEVLGDVVAKVSGMSFENYVEQNILKPVGMTDSRLMYTQADQALLVKPHVRKKGATQVFPIFPYNRKHGPSSTLISNAADMSRWMLVNLNRGELNGARILKDATYDLMWTSNDPAFPKIGKSWFLGEHRGCKTVAHGGSDIGFTCQLILLPEKKFGVAVLTNLNNAPVSKLALAAVDIWLDNKSGS